MTKYMLVKICYDKKREVGISNILTEILHLDNIDLMIDFINISKLNKIN